MKIIDKMINFVPIKYFKQKMKQLKLLSALLMCLFASSLPAYCTDEIKYFVLWHCDGSSTALALEEHPLIKVDTANKQLICCTDACEITLNLNDVKRYSFEETAGITSIDETNAVVGNMDKCGESLIFSNFAADTQVKVYTAAGVLKESRATDSSGSLTIHTDGLDKGLYIIKTEKTTYKFLIK